jgi:hypothetical protein
MDGKRKPGYNRSIQELCTILRKHDVTPVAVLYVDKFIRVVRWSEPEIWETSKLLIMMIHSLRNVILYAWYACMSSADGVISGQPS